MARKTKTDKWLESSDTIFKNLILTVAFVITITYTFLFFLAELGPEKPTEAVLYGTCIDPLATHITLFTLSIFFWVFSVFAKAKYTISKIEIEIEWSILLKWFSLIFLFSSLLWVPSTIIVLAMSHWAGKEAGSSLFLIFTLGLWLVSVTMTQPPRTIFRTKKK